AVQLGLEARVRARGQPGGLELLERGHERLGDVLPAVGAEAVLDRAHTRMPFTAAKNASSFCGSLTPGDASVPEATSTPHGCVAAIAAPTFSGVSPPESRNGVFDRRPASRPQSHVSPLPPRRPSTAVSSRCRSVW